MGELLALLSALGFTSRAVLIRRGLMEENPGIVWEINFVIFLTSLLLFLLVICIATLFGFNIIQEINSLTYAAILLLVLQGALGPVVGAFLITTAIAQIGASHSSALWGGSNPLFAILLAIMFLGERPSLFGIIGVVMIVCGILIVGYQNHAGTIALLDKTKVAGGIIALLSGLFFAFSQIARGAAIRQGATPNTGFFIGVITALITLTLICRIKSGNFKFLKHINRKSLLYYSGSGLGSLIGSYALLTAFTFVPVWKAIAIRNSQPLFAIILAWLILKKAETINLRIVLGASLITMGIVVLNVYP